MLSELSGCFLLQLKEKLRECLGFFFDAHSYFLHGHSSLSSPCQCQLCSCQRAQESSVTESGSSICNSSTSKATCYDRGFLLSLMVDVVLAYANVSLQQVDGYVLHLGRQVSFYNIFVSKSVGRNCAM